MRHLTRALAALALLSGAVACRAHAATPQLYLYEGNSCAVATQNAAARNMLGRVEDGDDVFVDYRYSADYAYTNVAYGIGCYKGQVANIAVTVPLAFTQPSAGGYGLTKGAYTLADVAAGKLDTFYAQVAHVLVADGFSAAQLRPGHEMNLNVDPWKASGQAATFDAAFCHEKAVMQAAEPTARFTFWLNPSVDGTASGEHPACITAADSGTAWDQYESWWTQTGKTTEPAAWQAAFGGYWGIASMASWYGTDRHAAPEVGAGLITSSAATTAQDDPYFMAKLIAYDVSQNVEWVGLWDNNSGYPGRWADGSHPGIALEVMKEWSPLSSTLAGSSLYTGTAYKVSAPIGYHAFLAQLANGDVDQLAWGDSVGQTLQATDLTAQAAAVKTTTAAPALTVTNSQGATASVVPNADGSAVIEVTFPTTAATVTYDLKLSSPRKLGFATAAGGVLGGFWQGGRLMTDFTWGTSGGAARVYVGAQ